jgi:putative protease
MPPELLAPAGSPEALRAAVQNGADAVYLGWGGFNARRNARNFSDDEFAGALRYCHERGTKVYLTLNTLVTDRELPQALETAKRACALGTDAVLVQDWGLLSLLRRVLPDLPLHASTQMSLFTSGGAREAAEAGCRRIVIARECSREETAAICRNGPAEVEVFVHGALCMCYSGQCAMSALIGGRSGNRGLCAQPCRLPYGVGAPADSHPLSLKDLCLADRLDELARAGVACLKLEGRRKRPEYVAVVTCIYARLLRENRKPSPAELRDLEAAFSRSGFTDWYWRGRKGPGMFGVRPESAPEPKELFAAAKAAYEKDSLRTVPVRFACTVRPGVPCTLTASDEDGHLVRVSGPVPETARNRAVTAEELSARLRKTGGTAYRCEAVRADAAPGLSLSAASVNALRRDALAALSAARTAVPKRRVLSAPPLPPSEGEAEEPRFTVSVFRAGQITPELLACAPARVYLPLEELDGLTALPKSTAEWCAVLPRVWRDGDEPELLALLNRAEALGVGGVLLGNLGHFPLARRSGLRLYGDFGLNVFNARSLAFLKDRGLRSACLSFELRASQLRDLPKVLPAEAIVYGRLPLMITENCLIANRTGCPCRQDGSPARARAGGRCAAPSVLNDRTGASFPLLPVYGHRTEIENCRPLYLGDRSEYRRLGLAYARLRFTTETPEECVRTFQDYLAGAPAPADFTRGLFDRGVE